MSDKGFKNGCVEFIQGPGHTPKTEHTCLYVNASNEFRFIDENGNNFILYGEHLDRCSVTKSANQEVAVTTWTAVIFDQETFDTNSMHDNASNNTRITIKTAGLYRIFYQVKTEAQDKTGYQTKIVKNGDTNINGSCNELVGSKDASFLCLNSVCPLVQLAVDDYVELQFYHADGTTQDVQSENTFLEVLRIF